MLLNSWDNVTLICGNHGKDYSHEMKLKEYLSSKHDSVFYNCPEYKSIYAKNDQRTGRSCNNRLSVTDFEKMLSTLYSMACSNPMEESDITGVSWECNGIYYKVLDQDEGHFKVLVLNKKAIAK